MRQFAPELHASCSGRVLMFAKKIASRRRFGRGATRCNNAVIRDTM